MSVSVHNHDRDSMLSCEEIEGCTSINEEIDVKGSCSVVAGSSEHLPMPTFPAIEDGNDGCGATPDKRLGHHFQRAPPRNAQGDKNSNKQVGAFRWTPPTTNHGELSHAIRSRIAPGSTIHNGSISLVDRRGNQEHNNGNVNFTKHRVWQTYQNEKTESIFLEHYLAHRMVPIAFPVIASLCVVLALSIYSYYDTFHLTVYYTLYTFLYALSVMLWLLAGVLLWWLRGKYNLLIATDETPESGRRDASTNTVDPIFNDTTIRNDRRENAASAERVMMIIFLANMCFTNALYRAKETCYGALDLQASFCAKSIELEGIYIMTLLGTQLLLPVRIPAFAFLTMMMVALLFGIRFLPGSPTIDDKVHVVSGILVGVQTLITLVTLWIRERSQRNAFELYVRRQLSAAELSVVRQQVAASVAAVVPLRVVREGATKDPDGLWGWNEQSVVCSVQLAGFPVWSARRSAMDSYELWQSLVQSLDAAREYFAHPRPHPYQSASGALGDEYLLVDHSVDAKVSTAVTAATSEMLKFALLAVCRGSDVIQRHEVKIAQGFVSPILVSAHDVEGMQVPLQVRAAVDVGRSTGQLLRLSRRLTVVGNVVNCCRTMHTVPVPAVTEPATQSANAGLFLAPVLAYSDHVAAVAAMSLSSSPTVMECEYSAGLRSEFLEQDVLQCRAVTMFCYQCPRASLLQGGERRSGSDANASTTVRKRCSWSDEGSTTSTASDRRAIFGGAAATSMMTSVSDTVASTTYTAGNSSSKDEMSTKQGGQGAASRRNPLAPMFTCDATNGIVTTERPLVAESDDVSVQEEELVVPNNIVPDVVAAASTQPLSRPSMLDSTIGHHPPKGFAFNDTRMEEAYQIHLDDDLVVPQMLWSGVCMMFFSIALIAICKLYGVDEFEALMPMPWALGCAMVSFVALASGTVAAECSDTTWFDALPLHVKRRVIRVIYNVCTWMYSAFFVTCVFVAPTGNALGNAQMVWLYVVFSVLMLRPQWYGPHVMWLLHGAVSVAFFVHAFYAVFPTPQARIMDLLIYSSHFLYTHSIWALLDYSHREAFANAQLVENLKSALLEDYAALEEALELMAPEGTAAELMGRVQRMAVMRGVHVRPKTLNPLRSTQVTTRLQSAAFALIQLHNLVDEVSKRGDPMSVTRSISRHLQFGQEMIHECLRNGFPELYVASGSEKSVVVAAHAPTRQQQYSRDRCVEYDHAFAMSLFALQLVKVVAASNRNVAASVFITAGPVMGALCGREFPVFQYHGSCLAEAQMVAPHVPLHSVVVTDRVFRMIEHVSSDGSVISFSECALWRVQGAGKVAVRHLSASST